MRGTARRLVFDSMLSYRRWLRAVASGFFTRALSGVKRSGVCILGPAARGKAAVPVAARIRTNMQNRTNIVSKITEFFGKKCGPAA